MSDRGERLSETIAALTAIGRRLTSSLREEAALFPLSSADAASEDIALMKSLDAFLQRFNQALDQVLRKLFPRVQAAITSSDELLTMRELLDSLHRIGLIQEVQDWLEMIEVRNRLTHEYALDAEERAAALNDAWSRAPALIEQIERTRDFAVARKLVMGNLR